MPQRWVMVDQGHPKQARPRGSDGFQLQVLWPSGPVQVLVVWPIGTQGFCLVALGVGQPCEN
eukprot:4760792-Alexandrium_andersonii.AAC.1